MKPLLEARVLSLRFGSLSLVQDLDMVLHPGEIVGIAGQCGAGKSVVVALLAGVQQPDSGELIFAGRRLTWPFSARELGMEVIHQQPEMV